MYQALAPIVMNLDRRAGVSLAFSGAVRNRTAVSTCPQIPSTRIVHKYKLPVVDVDSPGSARCRMNPTRLEDHSGLSRLGEAGMLVHTPHTGECHDIVVGVDVRVGIFLSDW